MDRFLKAATNPKTLFGVSDPYEGTDEQRRLVPPPAPPSPTPAQQRARIAPNVRQAAEATQAPAVAATGFGTVDTQAHVEQANDRRLRQTLAAQRAAFTPEAWKDIANRGMALGNSLFAEGRKEEAQEVLRLAYNAQLVSQDAEQADTHGAIRLSNMLGIIKDPYAGQRRNLAEAAAPGMMFTPEQQQELLKVERPSAPERAFSVSKDLADPLIGQLPAIVAGGAIGRTVAGAGGAALERAGLTRTGQAVGRLAQGIEPLERAGPAVPFTGGLRGARVAEELTAFRENAPYLLGRGATQGQLVGGLQAYRMARQQGASIEDAAAAAVESMGVSIPLGAATELGLGVAGRAAGIGYDPVARAIKPLADAIRGRIYGEAPLDRIEPGPDRAAMLGELGSSMEAVRGTRARASMEVVRGTRARAERQGELNDVFANATPDEEGLYHEQPFVPEPAEPTQEHPAAGAAERSNLVAQQHQVAADREAYEAHRAGEAAEHERVVAEAASQPPEEAVPDMAARAKAGDENARAYQEAINNYVDARVAIDDTPEGKQPSGMRQVALARAKAALNAAREQYGTTVGAAAITALAANDEDLTDDEKAAVGLGGLAILGSQSVVPHVEPEVRTKIIDYFNNQPHDTALQPRDWAMRLHADLGVPRTTALGVMHGLAAGGGGGSMGYFSPPLLAQRMAESATSTGFVSRLKQAIEGMPGKRWDEPQPAADWIGKLKGVQGLSKVERDLIMPYLENAQKAKTKVTRGDVLTMAESAVPELKRLTLAAGGGGPEDASLATTHRILDVDEVPAHDRPAIERQIELREQARYRAQAEIDEDIADREETMNHAEREKDRRSNDLENMVERHGLPASVLRDAFDYLDETITSSYVRDRDVEAAFEKIQGELNPETDVEEVLRDNHITVTEGPGEPVTTIRYETRWGDVQERTIGDRPFDDFPTEAAARRQISQYYGEAAAASAKIKTTVPDPDESGWVVRAADGEEIARGDDREEAIANLEQTDWYMETVLDPARDDLWNDVRNKLWSYAEALGEYKEAESSHYSATEDGENVYESQHEAIQEHSDAIDALESTLQALKDNSPQVDLADANEGAALWPPDERPIKPVPDQPTWFHTFQRVARETAHDYHELLITWPGAPEEYGEGHYTDDAYKPMGGRLIPNEIGHARLETQHIPFDQFTLHQGRIEMSSLPPETPSHLVQAVNEKRVLRAEKLKEMHAIYARLEELERGGMTAATASEEATRLVEEFRDRDRELEEINRAESGRLASLRQWLERNGHGKPEVRPALLMTEAQSDWSQDAHGMVKRIRQLMQMLGRDVTTADATEAAFAAEPPTFTADEIALARGKLQAAREAQTAAASAYSDAANRKEVAQAVLGQALDRIFNNYDEMGRYVQSPIAKAFEETNLYRPSAYQLKYAGYEDAWAWLEEHGTDDLKAAIQQAREAAEAADAAHAARYQAATKVEQAGAVARFAERPDLERNVPPSPWARDTRTTLHLIAAAVLMDMAERGLRDLVWSDAENRVLKANLKPKAAKLQYETLFPSVLRDILKSVAKLKETDVPVNKVYVADQGHFHIRLPEENKEGLDPLKIIRRLGISLFPVAVAAAALPDEAEAQTGEEKRNGSSTVFRTGLGMAAGAGALVALAKSRKLRRTLAEFPELAKRLNVDDVTGFAAKRALTDARATIDADPAQSWAVFRPTENLAKLPAAKRDAALKAHASAIMAAAEQAGLPMQGFRAGATDLAFALPEAKAADFVDAVEKSTAVRGQFGKTLDAAQALASDAESADRHGITLYANPIGPAIREVMRYPSAAALAGLGAVATQSDDPNVRDAGLPIIALAGLHAIGSRRIGAGKDKLASKLVESLSRSEAGTSAVRFFNPDALLTPEVKQAILDYEHTVKAGEAKGAQFSREAQKLGPAGDRAVSDVLDNETWEDPNQFSPDDIKAILAVATELGQEYTTIGNEKVRTGVLPKTSLLPDYGGPRKYAFYEANDALGEPGPARGPGATRIGQQKTRTLDIPLREAEEALKDAQATGDPAKIKAAEDALDEAKVVQMSQRVERGEIREASYRAGQGIPRAYQDIAAGQLFQTLRNTPGVAHPEWVRATDDLQAAQQLKRAATTPADRDAAQALIDDAKVRLADLTRKYAQAGGDYVSLPDTPGMGQLRGAVVDRDVAHSLVGFSSKSLYQKMLKGWKEIKTIFNPGTHAANVMSNIMFLHTAGLPVWEQPLYLKRAAADLRKYGPATKAATEAGFLGVNFVGASGEGVAGRPLATEEGLTQLLGMTRPETADVLRREGITEERANRKAFRRTVAMTATGAALGAAKMWDDEDPAESLALGAALGAGAGYGLSKAAGKIRATYGREDDLFRVAWMLKQLKEGRTMEQAVNAGRDVLGDFRSRSPALALLRNTVLPFALWPAKALPKFAQHIVDHPWRYLTLMAAMAGVNEYSKNEVGEIPDASVPEGQRRLFGYFLPGLVQLPFKDQQGNKAAVDVSRWSPGAAATTAANPSSVPAALMGGHALDIFRPQGPAVDLATRFGSNIDPFRGQQWLGPDYPARDNAQRFANAVSGIGLPSVADYYAPMIRDDIKARDWFKLENDVQGISGLRVRYNRPAANIITAENQLRESLRVMKQEYTRALQGNHNPGRAETLNQQYVRRVRSAIDAFTRRMGQPPADPALHELLRQP